MKALRVSRGALFFVIPVNSPVATFEQSKNVAIAHLEPEQLLAVRGVASAMIGTGLKFISLPSGHVHGTNRQSCTGRILFVHRLRLYGL